MASQIIEIISGESVTIGDIVNDNGSTEGEPFGSEYHCYAKAISSNNKCLTGLIPALTRTTDSEPFEVVLAPEHTATWDGKVTLVITVSNSAPYADASGTLVPGLGATVVGKEKVYIKAEKFC